MLTRSLRSVSMSRTWGMFSRMISSSVRMAAAMQGRAEFFAPETLMVPRRGLPPRTTNLSITYYLRDLLQFTDVAGGNEWLCGFRGAGYWAGYPREGTLSVKSSPKRG